jgi:transaldolase
VYTPHQVLLAQAIGADYVAPYLGRMSDGDLSGLLQSNSAFAFQQQHTDDEKADAGGCSSYGGMDRSLRGMEVVS